MKDWIAQMDWQASLNQGKGPLPTTRPPMSHERAKYQWLTRIEKLIGRQIFAYSNWNIVKP